MLFKKKDKSRDSTRESSRESSRQPSRESSRQSSRESARHSKILRTTLSRTSSEPISHHKQDETIPRYHRSTTSSSMLNDEDDVVNRHDMSELSSSRGTETSTRSTDSYNPYRTTAQFRSTAMSALDELEEVDNSPMRGTAIHVSTSRSSEQKAIETAAVTALHAEVAEIKEEMQAIKREMMNEMHTTRYDMLKEVTMLKGTIMQLIGVIQQSGSVSNGTAMVAGTMTEQQRIKPSEDALQVMARQPSRVSSKMTKERITNTREDLIAPVYRQSSRLTQLVSVDDSALSSPLDQDQLDELFPLVDCTTDVQIMSQIRDSSTREWVFERVQGWLDSRFEVGADTVLAMVGGAGSGKSVAAAAVCDKFCDQVVAQHFCKFDKKVKSSPRSLLLSLVNQLTGSLPSFKNQLARLNLKYVLDETDAFVLARKVLVDPLNALEEPLTGKVIVIDGIDQCRQGTGVNELLDFLSVILPECPKWMGFIVTSKPSPEFASLMPVNSLLDFSANNPQYLNDTMLLINEIANVFNENEASQGKTYLREKSGGNFAYLVFTKQALSHPGMEGEDGYIPVEMLQDLPESLYAIYEEIFEDKFGKGRNRLWRKAQPVLELIVSSASGPYPQITEHQVMETLTYTKDEVRMLRRAFVDVVSIRQGTYSIISSAMYDWLSDPARENEHFFVDVQSGVKTLKAFLRGEASSHHVIKDDVDEGDRITIKLRAPLSSLTDSNSSSGSSDDGSPKSHQLHAPRQNVATNPTGILKKK